MAFTPVSDQSIQSNAGGQYSTFVAGTNNETLVYTGKGRLAQISFATVGTQTLSVYDGTQSTGGTLIYTSATNPTAGSAPVALNWPIATGITLKGTSSAAHGVCVAYNKAGVNGT